MELDTEIPVLEIVVSFDLLVNKKRLLGHGVAIFCNVYYYGVLQAVRNR